MFCSISGEVPQHPVVTKSGHVYERRLIEKYIEENQRDPMTGESLTAEDLIAIHQSDRPVAKPRAPAATSIPSLISMFQNEWDAAMLESFTLKQQFHQLRQELAHSLYQNDAAQRVIARLMKERDAAREALASFQSQLGHAPAPAAAVAADSMDVDEAEGGAVESQLSAEVTSRIVSVSEELSKNRRKRKQPEDLITAEDLGTFSVLDSVPNLHAASGILAVDVNPRDSSQYVTAGGDKHLSVISRQGDTQTLKSHTKKVTDVFWHPTSDVLVSGSADKSVKVWTHQGDKYTVSHTIKAHAGEVTAVAAHPTGSHCVSAAEDGAWALHDLESGETLCKVGGQKEGGYASACVHPDGLIMATGASQGGVVKIWDIKSQTVAFECPEVHQGRVASLAFSENGYYFVSASDAEPVVKVWDLRKLAKVHEIQLGADAKVNALRFNSYGNYLAVAGSDLRVYLAKQWTQLLHISGENQKELTDVVFGDDASSVLATVGMDRTLKFFGRT